MGVGRLHVRRSLAVLLLATRICLCVLIVQSTGLGPAAGRYEDIFLLLQLF